MDMLTKKIQFSDQNKPKIYNRVTLTMVKTHTQSYIMYLAYDDVENVSSMKTMTLLWQNSSILLNVIFFFLKKERKYHVKM